MRKTLNGSLKLLIMLAIVFLWTVLANAALVDNLDGTITDTSTNYMWLQDANYAATSGYFAYGSDSGGTGMSFDDSVTWANTLDYAGYQDWRLPWATNPDGTGPFAGFISAGGTGELGQLAYTEGIWPYTSPNGSGPFINVQGGMYWTGTSAGADDAFINTATGSISQSAVFRKLTVVGPDQWTPTRLGAWAVRDCGGPCPTPPVVPEPLSSTLFIAGAATLGFWRFSKRRNA